MGWGLGISAESFSCLSSTHVSRQFILSCCDSRLSPRSSGPVLLLCMGLLPDIGSWYPVRLQVSEPSTWSQALQVSQLEDAPDFDIRGQRTCRKHEVEGRAELEAILEEVMEWR